MVMASKISNMNINLWRIYTHKVALIYITIPFLSSLPTPSSPIHSLHMQNLSIQINPKPDPNFPNASWSTLTDKRISIGPVFVGPHNPITAQ